MLHFQVKTFNDFTTEELYEVLRVRSEVFVLEQECLYLDMDKRDQVALHVYLEEEDRVVAYLRILPPGVQCEEMAIGRVLTTERGKGYGERLLRRGIKEAYGYFGVDPIRIEAQSYTEKFYEKFGFKRVSVEFLEDGIPHIEMYLKAPEIWDLYDKDFNLLDKKMVRGEAFTEGEYHLVCDVLLEHEDGSFLVMTRDANKDIRPGALEATAGGSAETGETPLECAKRELLEETGISIKDLTFIKKELGEHSHYYYFHARTNVSKDAVKLQEGETTDYQWVTKAKLEDLVQAHLFSPRHEKHLLEFL